MSRLARGQPSQPTEVVLPESGARVRAGYLTYHFFRFVNLDGSEPQPLSAVLKWAMVDRVLDKRRSDGVGNPAPRVEPDLERLQQPPGPGQTARLTWLGHASWLVQLHGVSLPEPQV